MKAAGRSWNELRFLAADRQKWKGLIDNPCSQKERWTLLLLLLLLNLEIYACLGFYEASNSSIVPTFRDNCRFHLQIAQEDGVQISLTQRQMPEITHRLTLAISQCTLQPSDIQKNSTNTYKSAIFVVHGCETWYIILREENRPRVFEERVLR